MMGGGLFESGRKNYDRAGCHRGISFWVGEICKIAKPDLEGSMDRKQKRSQRARHPKLKPSRSQRKQVLTLTAAGKNRELVATETGTSIAKLRTDYAQELDEGRRLAMYRRAEEVKDEISLEEFHFCDVLTNSFNSHWFNPTEGNLLFAGVDGRPAKNILDAFRAWKLLGGRYRVTGLSRKLSKDKVQEFAKIVAEYNKGKSQP